ncbi:hypothetical protein WA026_014120 [Henosepilachna vigintioctopunctata]|uniref:Transcription cofactor vestigial-like protein 4 n=1 Tax=Henosepilachna vigintioctopunctata TaxID=420089 RepID=A0AAW1TTM6_9CUCU
MQISQTFEKYCVTNNMDISNFLQNILRVSHMLNAQENYSSAKETKMFWQPWVDKDDQKECSNKQLPTSKWKRERRSRLPEYSRAEYRLERNGETSNGDYQVAASEQQVCSTNGYCPRGLPKEKPIDMSVRHRGLPPSYAQTMNSPGYRSNYRHLTNTSGISTPTLNEEIPAGMSMCDPIIDEHFRRSLGEDYHTLYTNNNIVKDVSRVKSSSDLTYPSSRNVDIGDLMDDTGMSVDDHFAKALGETWVKLNKKQQDLKSNSSDNQNLVSI